MQDVQLKTLEWRAKDTMIVALHVPTYVLTVSPLMISITLTLFTPNIANGLMPAGC
jgi:hypothetical protein